LVWDTRCDMGLRYTIRGMGYVICEIFMCDIRYDTWVMVLCCVIGDMRFVTTYTGYEMT